MSSSSTLPLPSPLQFTKRGICTVRCRNPEYNFAVFSLNELLSKRSNPFPASSRNFTANRSWSAHRIVFRVPLEV